jgi:hypothetical protein
MYEVSFSCYNRHRSGRILFFDLERSPVMVLEPNLSLWMVPAVLEIDHMT